MLNAGVGIYTDTETRSLDLQGYIQLRDLTDLITDADVTTAKENLI